MNHVSVDEAIASSPVLQRILSSPGATGGYIINLPELKNDERVIMASRHVLHKSQRGTGFYKTLLQQLGVVTAQQWSGKAPFDITIAQIDAEVGDMMNGLQAAWVARKRGSPADNANSIVGVHESSGCAIVKQV